MLMTVCECVVWRNEGIVDSTLDLVMLPPVEEHSGLKLVQGFVERVQALRVPFKS